MWLLLVSLQPISKTKFVAVSNRKRIKTMLVKKSVVEQWYVKTHPVYKNFAYMFDNPLWSKSVPNGFSVCPYFWLSLFSLFVVKPFVRATLWFRPKIRKLGRPAFL